MLQIQNLFKSNSDAHGPNSKRTNNNVWRPLGRLPMWSSKTEEGMIDIKSLKKINRYLSYMEGRLFKLHAEGDYNRVVTLWSMLLKISKSYQLTVFHRARPDWYWKISERDAKKSLRSFMNQCRNWDMTLTLERFYLFKSDLTRVPVDYMPKEDEKIRPIGSPTYESRMISKSVNDLIYFVLHDQLTSFQHAYRLSRGTHTALIEVWLRIVVLKHNHIREFDFASFFNNVKIDWVIQFLNTKSRKLACWVDSIYNQIRYKFDREITKLPKDSEISVEEDIPEGVIPIITRKGLPQGLSISPILATAILGFLPKLEGLVMYADDGLIIRKDDKDDKEVTTWFDWAWKLGVYLEPSKSGPVGKQFKFLGVQFDLEKETVTYKDSSYSWKGRGPITMEIAQEIYQWFKLVGQFYGKKPEGWTWKIHPEAVITRFGFNLQWRKRLGEGRSYVGDLKELFGKLYNSKTYKGFRIFIGRGIYHISSSSTKSCGYLLKLQKDLRLVKVKSFSWFGKPFRYRFERKGKYMEERSLSRVTAYSESEFSYIHDQSYWEELRSKSKTEAFKIVDGPNHIVIRRIATNKYNMRGRKIR